MSKQTQYMVTIKNVENTLLKKAVERMAQELHLKIIHKTRFYIYNHKKIPIHGTCVRLPHTHYPVDIYASQGQVVFNGDEIDTNQYQKIQEQLKQFYAATELSEEFQTDFEYDRQNEKILLKVLV